METPCAMETQTSDEREENACSLPNPIVRLSIFHRTDGKATPESSACQNIFNSVCVLLEASFRRKFHDKLFNLVFDVVTTELSA